MCLGNSGGHIEIHISSASIPLALFFHLRQLNDWTRVLFPTTREIVNRRKYKYRANHQTAVVHVRRSDFRKRGPETKEQDDDEVDAGNSIVDDSKNARDSPRSPDQLSTRSICQSVRVNVSGKGKSSCASSI